MKQQTIVISGINMVEGGIFTILDNMLQQFSEINAENKFKIIALVHNKQKFNYKNIEYLEFPKSKKSWLNRLYYEYYYFKKLSKKIMPDVWFSLHDTTPNVIAKKQFVYLHHPNTLVKIRFKDWFFNYKVGLFSVFYDFLFQFNLKKNHTVFVQQHWIKEVFENRFKINNIKVAQPNFIEEITTEKFNFTSNKIHFFYPSYPRSLKNHDIIFKAIQKLPKNIAEKCEFHFTTLKNNTDKYAQFLIQKYGRLKNVVFYGEVSRKQLFAMYNTINCLLFPSKVETWGLPISEAKAYQKPMFLANLPYAKETCGAYEKVTFFNEENATELAKIITEFVEEKHIFQGNSKTFYTTESLQSWEEMFQYIIKN